MDAENECKLPEEAKSALPNAVSHEFLTWNVISALLGAPDNAEKEWWQTGQNNVNDGVSWTRNTCRRKR